MDRDALSRWVDAYERAWREPGVEALDAVFAEDATYRTAPFEPPFQGLAAIREMWEAGRAEGEAFAMRSEIVAVEGDAGVVRVSVRYERPRDQAYEDIWIVRLVPDGRCAGFEEWPFWPPGSGGGWDPGPDASGAGVDLRLEVVQVPVADVDRAAAFYVDRAGFVLDHDTRVSDAVRVVQLTPRGSACSIVIGTGLSEQPAGSARGLQLVVADMELARAELVGRGVEVSDVEVMGRPGRTGFRLAHFRDPDGNAWTVQEIPGSGCVSRRRSPSAR